MRLRYASIGTILCLLAQTPILAAPKSHIVGGVNFDEATINGNRLHNGTYTQDDPNITTSIEDVLSGKVAGKTVAVVLLKYELPATGADYSAEAYEVSGTSYKKLGTLAEYEYFTESEGPHLQGPYIAVTFAGNKMYADAWQHDKGCDPKHDWLSTAYTIRNGKLFALNRLAHHRASVRFQPCSS